MKPGYYWWFEGGEWPAWGVVEVSRAEAGCEQFFTLTGGIERLPIEYGRDNGRFGPFLGDTDNGPVRVEDGEDA